mgnify:CR=1 FL=1
MPNPTVGDLHVVTELTDLSVGHFQDMGGFVAPKVAPFVRVANQANKFRIYSRDDLARAEMQLRAPNSESAGGGWRVTQGDYSCDRWGLHKDIADDERANDDVGDLDAEATEWLTEQWLIRMEKEWAFNFFKTGVWGLDRAGNAAPTGDQFLFWDAAAAVPVSDIQTSKRTIRKAARGLPGTGAGSFKFVIGTEAYAKLLEVDSVEDKIKHTQLGITTPQLLAMMFGVSEVIEAEACETTSAEAAATQTGDFIVNGKDGLLLWVPNSPGKMKPSAMYTFVWTGKTGVSELGNRIKRFRQEQVDGDRIEIDAYFDQVKVAGGLGVFFDNLVQ